MPKKIIVITKKTSYSKYIQDQDDEGSRELLRTQNPAVAFWQSSHNSHMRTLNRVVEEIQKQNIVCTVIDSKSFVVDPDDVAMVISVGGDGTLLSASHSVNGTLPILGVNSDPETSIGFFCYSTADTFLKHLLLALDSMCIETELTRMSVRKNGKFVANRILNDVLFCHTNPAATSNYIIQLMNHSTRTMAAVQCGTETKLTADKVLPLSTQETQRSSGIWVGPAAGSTAARRSAGASPMNLSSKDLQLRVRELYYRPSSQPGRIELTAAPGQFIKVISKMDSAAMYLDGDYSVIPVGLGDEINFEMSDESLHLLGKPNVLCGK
ncbi:NAD(+)/NADH kinase [Candidatus Pacearchaeota archaeon]|jgi:NAD+ kinase|nr:NAD(+)/NADH kinase [Candidatus Pacearchaeota archaeon]